jgi:hypothetical protein
MEAVYDDYGRVKLHMTDSTREELAAFLHELYQRTGRTGQGESSRDTAFDLRSLMDESAPGFVALNTSKPWYSEGGAPDDGSLDAEMLEVFQAVWGAAMGQRVFVKNSAQVVRPLQFAVAHEAAYRALVELASRGEDWDGIPMHAEGFVTHRVAQAREADREDEGKQGMAMFHTLQGIMNRYVDEGLSGFRAKTGFSAAVRALTAGKIDDATFVRQVAPMLEGRYAFRGLSILNLRFVPMSLCGQDDANRIGKAYATFIRQASIDITRDTIESRYGKLVTYSLTLPSALADSAEAAVQVLSKRIRDYDGEAIHHTVVAKDEGVHVMLECTLDIDTLRDLLIESDDTRASAESVVQLG